MTSHSQYERTRFLQDTSDARMGGFGVMLVIF